MTGKVMGSDQDIIKRTRKEDLTRMVENVQKYFIFLYFKFNPFNNLVTFILEHLLIRWIYFFQGFVCTVSPKYWRY